MGPVSAIVTYIILWWTVIFCVLPFGIERDEDGTPKAPYIGKKVIITSVIAAVLLGVVFALIELDVIDFRSYAKLWADKDYHSKG